MGEPDEFRREARAWLEQNCPASMRGPAGPTRSRATRAAGADASGCSPARTSGCGWSAWRARGWTAPKWPQRLRRRRARQGRGQGPARGAARASRRARRSRASASGCSGPRCSSTAARSRSSDFLPQIVRGEIRWCQGYSRAGRRLRPRRPADPRPRTRATTSSSTARRSGPPTPTRPTGSSAWCAPTRRAEARGHQLPAVRHGRRPASAPRPIRLISGSSPFCETFFDNVRVPKDNLVGELNKGWDIAKYLLTHEREMIGGLFGVGGAGQRDAGRDRACSASACENGRLADPGLRHRHRAPRRSTPRRSR